MATANKTARRPWLWVGLAAGTLAIAGVATVAPLVFEPNHYASIASIEQRPDYRDPRLMAAAWALPVAAAYRRQPYEYQDNPSFCGPTSVADVLHSIGNTMPQHQVIAGTPYRSWFGLLPGGLTLDQLADIARTRVHRPAIIHRDTSLAAFRQQLHAANDPGRRYIVNFHRGPLFGRGHGHFSPILGYLESRDLVLVGDVNADYRPFLVSSQRLWTATRAIDPATDKPRGLIEIRL